MREQSFPRVLLISHNALSQTKNNGKTLASFFSGWEPDHLAQFYITPELPDSPICNRFFRITDGQILRAVIHPSMQPGGVAEAKTELSAVPNPAAGKKSLLGRLVERRPYWLLLARDLCWGLKRWKTPQLKAWLDEFAPEAVFLQCSAPAIYEIAFWVCERYHIPFFLEITDDYTSSRFSLDPFFWIYLGRMRRQMRRAISMAERTLVIGEKMEKEYQKRFGGTYYIAMNSVETEPYEAPTPHDPMRIVFTGNLGLNRWKTIETLGCVCSADPELRDHVQIDLYSGTCLTEEQTRCLNQGVLSFHGSVSAAEVVEIQKGADVLLHVESFDADARYITRYSVSTKIAEYFSRGKCVLAIGPDDVASIEYIRDRQLGVAITELEPSALQAQIRGLLHDPERRSELGKRGHARAEAFHNIQTVQRDIHDMICSAVNN